MQKFILGLSLLLGLGACSPKPQNDCGYVQNVYGERISWKGRIPIELKLHQSFPKEFEGAAVEAAETWNRASGKTIFKVDTSSRVTGPIESRKDTKNIIYLYDTWEADRTNEQARTSIYWKGDLIEEADIRVNSKFSYYVKKDKQPASQPASASVNGVNIQALLIHEMGHVLGLKHDDASPSVMATYLRVGADRVELMDADKKDLKCEY